MLGEDIIGFFEAIGPLGLMIAFSVISFFDGLLIPTLPEAWLILIAISDVGIPQLLWALMLILIGTASAVTAQILLFLFVKRVGLPKRVRKLMNKYTQFLCISDEKLAFMNWIAPVVPLTGAFIAVCDWRPKLAFIYSTLGGLLKMTLIVIIAMLFPLMFSPDMVADASIILVIVILALSISISMLRKRRMTRRVEQMKLSGENSAEK